jgi:2-polyprenyl-3-methyl-5-hydroxy-6-metoxy-1,4-benzoquinol methylase
MKNYKDFQWDAPTAPNGDSGRGLADSLTALVQKLESTRSICDLGSGNGYLAGRLAKLGYSVTGIDASPSGIELARRHYPNASFICSQIDLDSIHSLPKAEFDLVISSDVIEHLYRPADLLEAAASLIRDGGHLIIGTPYHGYLKNLALSISGRMDAHFTALWNGGHIKFFSVRTLEALVRQHGFTDLSFSFYGRAPYLWKNMICHAVKSKARQDA